MRRIKSAPANLCEMKNRKKDVKFSNINPVIIFKNNNQELFKYKKNIVSNKKKITNTISGIISDTFLETNKILPYTDTFYFSYLVEFVNNFLNNKFNRKNLENLVLSLMVRFIFNQVYHDVLTKIKEQISN